MKIVQIMSAHGWLADYKDGARPLVGWALAKIDGGAVDDKTEVVGLVAETAAVVRAETLPGFSGYRHAGYAILHTDTKKGR